MRPALALFLLLAAPAFAHDHADKAGHGHEEVAVPAKPVQITSEGAVYGAKLPEATPAAVSLDSAIEKPNALLGKTGAFSGRITEVCQEMGCWMVLAADNGKFVRVIMHDHAFGVPKDAKGEAVVYGKLNEKMLSAKESAHLKKDGAKTAAKSELQIDATSVLIRKVG